MGTQYVTEYAELARQKKMGLRGLARHITLSCLGAWKSKNGNTEEAFSKNRIQFIYVHHTFNDEEDRFRSLLRRLEEKHTFIAYSDAVNKLICGGPIDRPYIAFSADDGLRNSESVASILGEFGGTCCLFVCPSMIGITDFARIRAFNEDRLRLPPIEYLSWDDLEHLKNNGHEIGNHTSSHVMLPDVSTSIAEDEIGESYEELRKRLGSVHHFAWPYGRFEHFSEQFRKIVFETGHLSCASAERGCHMPGEAVERDQLCIRRDHLILAWPLNHMYYFLTNSASSMKPENNKFPY